MLTDAVDISALPPGETDRALEALHKALSGRPEKIWQPSGLPRLAVAEAEVYEVFAGRLGRAYNAIAVELGATDRAEHAGASMFLKADAPGKATAWTSTDIDDWMRLVDRVVEQYVLGAGGNEVEAALVRAYLAGRVREAAAQSAVRTVAAAVKAHGLNDRDRWVLEHVRARGATQVRGVAESVRAGIRSTLIDAHMARTPSPAVARTLREKFGEANKDWRRIAITEAAEAHNQGFLASVKVGTRVKRQEARDACSFCRSIHGKTYEVVSPDAESKDWDTQVWVGKTNVERSRHRHRKIEGGGVDLREDSELWKPCAVVHPHCRGYFVAVRP